MENLELFIDGASSGNPGPSGIGVVILRDGRTAKEMSRFIGPATNNIAEYTALIAALTECLKMRADHVLVNTDSQLLHRQLNGEYKVRQPHIAALYRQAVKLIACFKQVRIQHIRREFNKEADRLAVKAIRQATRNDQTDFRASQPDEA